MAEDISNPLLASLIAFNEQKSAKTGVRSNDPPGKVSPSLTSNETARYKKIFTIMKDILEPGDEAARIKREKQSAKTPMQASMGTFKTQGGGKGSGLGLLGGLGGLLGSLGLGALMGGLEDWWNDNKGKLSDNINKALSTVIDSINITKLIDKLADLGKAINALEAGINLGKNSKAGKALTQLGLFFKSGGAGKFLDNYKGLDGIRLAIMGFGDFVKGFFAPVLKLLSAFADNPLIKAMGTVGGAAAGAVKGVGKGGIKLLQMVGRAFTALSKTRAFRFLPFIGSAFNFATAMQAYGNGNYGRMMLEIISGVVNLIPGGQIVSAILDGGLLIYDLFSDSEEGAGLRDITSRAGGFLGKMFESIGDALWGMITGIGDVIGNIFTSIYDWVVENANPMNWFSGDTPKKPTVASAAKYGMSSGGYLPYMNDGMIYHNGTMTAINSQDDILAAKNGGPIDKLLARNQINIDDSKLMTELNAYNKSQLETLVAIKKGIDILALAAKPAADVATALNYTYNPLTTEFAS